MTILFRGFFESLDAVGAYRLSQAIDDFYQLVDSGIGILRIVLAASKAGFFWQLSSCTQQHPTRKQGDPGIWQRSKEPKSPSIY